jgi:class 3 adenylate cyclase
MNSVQPEPWAILVVDDEPDIVSVIERQFEREPYRLTCMSDSRQALAALEQTHFALILSDNRMPRVSGLVLLKAALARSPNTRRILLTGYTDQDAAIRAFNDKVIHRYLQKPWNPAELLDVVREELALYADRQREEARRQELERLSRKRSRQLQAALSAIRQAGEEFAEQAGAQPVQRLAAVIVADVVGFSRLMGDDPDATLRTLNACRGIWRTLIARHGGRLVNAPGDSLLAEFESAAQAVLCARDVQHALRALNTDLPAARRMDYRVGVTVGEVLEQGGSLYGNGINVAARLQALAAPGEVWISQGAYELVKAILPEDVDDMGEQQLHNIAAPVSAYRIRF